MSKKVRIEYNVIFDWDDEASVWVATSDEIEGLVLESEQFDELLEKVRNAVPELLELNGQVPASRLNCKINNRKVEYV